MEKQDFRSAAGIGGICERPFSGSLGNPRLHRGGPPRRSEPPRDRSGAPTSIARGFPHPAPLLASVSDVGVGAGTAVLSQQICVEVTEGRAQRGGKGCAGCSQSWGSAAACFQKARHAVTIPVPGASIHVP